MKFSVYFCKLIAVVFFSASFNLIKAQIADDKRPTATDGSQRWTAAISGCVAWRMRTRLPTRGISFGFVFSCAYYAFIFPSKLTI